MLILSWGAKKNARKSKSITHGNSRKAHSATHELYKERSNWPEGGLQNISTCHKLKNIKNAIKAFFLERDGLFHF